MSGSDPHNQPDEAMIDLLIKQVTEGLSPEEQRALDVMDSAVASAHLRELERAAAAISVVGSADAVRPPEELLRRLQSQAEQHFGAATGTAAAASPNVAKLAGAGRVDPVPVPATARRSRAGNGAYGWLAAAACLVLAVVAWNRQPPTEVTVLKVPPVRMPSVLVKPEPLPPPVAEQRATLMAKADSLKITLGATKDPAAAGMSGDVVWDPATQRGFLRFVGLAPNDPAMHQYQLWIFDGARDKRYPVDGGVFDIPANSAGEIVIPIHAALQVIAPKAFAVTVEKPGGVVVSGREHVVALGAAS